MKQKLVKVLALSLVMGLLSGCAGTPVVINPDAVNTGVNNEQDATSGATSSATNDATSGATENANEDVVVSEGAVKTGLALIVNNSASKTGEYVDYDVTMVAVLVDDNGVIVDCAIDSIATKVNFDATGTVTTNVNAEVSTKNELGENYGMVAWGGAIAEWDAQAAALANYAVGKTVEELRNGAIDETGKAPAGSDLASSATIYLGGYVSAIEAAVANAKHLGAQAGDEVRLASVNSLASTTNATAEKAGNAQLDSDVAVVSVNNGVITSCYFDAVQAKVAFDATGTITSDISVAPLTKNQLGDKYGMVAWGGAIAEWDAQAASFAAYVVGKTADEVAGIAVNEKTVPTEADLTSSVTIAVGGFQGLIKKALQ